MDREIKALPFTNIKAQSSGRIRAGIASVFGNIDEIGDRVMPGAFQRTIDGGAKRARFLWNHSYQHPPVATITELRELSRAELPQEVLDKAPDATGGLLVKRDYYDTDLSNWILQAIDAGDINEMSFAFEIVRSSMVQEPIDNDPENVQHIRNIEEVKLYDCSDVLWGCNAATVAAGAKSLGLMPLGAIAAQFLAITEELKAGRRNSTSDQKLIDMMHSACVDLGASNCPMNEESDDDEPKSEKPEPADSSTSPSPNWIELQKAKTRVLALQNSIN